MANEVKRENLIARLLVPDVRLMSLFASAGYGKSTLARQLGEEIGSATVCDLAGVRGRSELLTRVLCSISPQDDAAESAFSRFSDPDAAVEHLRRRWSLQDHPYVVFENAEHLAGDSGALSLLSDLLRDAPSTRRICVCSRVRIYAHPEMRPSRIARPHEIASLTEADLALDRNELARLTNSSGRELDRWVELTRGWPLCVRLILRLATHTAIEQILSHLDTIDFEILYDYLIDHVIETLDERSLRILVALAAFAPNPADLRRLFPDEGDNAVAIARANAFVEERDGEFHLHPLVRESVARRYVSETKHMVACAAERALREDPVRAALLYTENEEFEKAAQALQTLQARALYFSHDPQDPAFATVLARLPRSTLLPHPALAGIVAQYCGLTFSNEERLVYQLRAFETASHLPEDDPSRLALVMGVLNALTNLGRHQEALQFAEAIETLDTPVARYYRRLMGVVRSRMGDFSKVFEDYDAILQQAGQSYTALAICTYELLAKTHRARGEFELEIAALERALEYAQLSSNPLALALSLMEMAFGAWFRGDDAALARAVADIDANQSPLTEPGMRLFNACLKVEVESFVPDVARPQIHAYAYLIALSNCRPERTHAVAEMAVRAADSSGEPFLSCIARVAHSFVQVGSARAMLLEAARFAQTVDSQPLQEAVAALGRDEILPIFAGLYSRVTGNAIERDRYLLSHFRRTLSRGPVRLSPSPREMEVLCFLGFADRPVTRDELAEAMMPDASSDAGSAIVRVCISRIRKKFGQDIILSTERGYELGPRVSLPLRDVRARVLVAEARRKLLPGELFTFHQDLAALRYGEALPPWEWANSLESELASLQDRISALLPSP